MADEDHMQQTIRLSILLLFASCSMGDLYCVLLVYVGLKWSKETKLQLLYTIMTSKNATNLKRDYRNLQVAVTLHYSCMYLFSGGRLWYDHYPMKRPCVKVK